MRTLVSTCQNLALLVVRIAFGLLLVAHAWHRFRQVGMAHEVAYLQAHHVAQPYLLAWGSVLLEGVGGVLLVFGLMVPLVALALLVQNILVIVWLRWGNGVYLHNGGFELNLVQACLATLLLFFGSGRAGLDALFRGHRDDREQLSVRDRP